MFRGVIPDDPAASHLINELAKTVGNRERIAIFQPANMGKQFLGGETVVSGQDRVGIQSADRQGSTFDLRRPLGQMGAGRTRENRQRQVQGRDVEDPDDFALDVWRSRRASRPHGQRLDGDHRINSRFSPVDNRLVIILEDILDFAGRQARTGAGRASPDTQTGLTVSERHRRQLIPDRRGLADQDSPVQLLGQDWIEEQGETGHKQGQSQDLSWHGSDHR